MSAEKPGLLLIGPATRRMRDRMDAEFTVHELFTMEDADGFLAEHGASIMAVATDGHFGVKPDVMAHLPNLAVISCYGVGYDNIDAAACAANGIFVTHTPGVLNAEVASTAILLMLAVCRNLVAADAHVRAGRWADQGNVPLSRATDNRTVGILGLGRIGQEIARKLQAFNATVVYHSRHENPDQPYRYYPDLKNMAADVDTLIAITPGGAATRHLIDRRVMDALGPEGILINVGRGSVVDEGELVRALAEGRLGYAGLDVFEDEPRVPAALWAMENVTLTPHIASATVETRTAMGDLTTDNLSQFLRDGTVISPVPECQNM